MPDETQTRNEYHRLHSRVLELEHLARHADRFWARITADHADGTYDTRRLIATAPNVFADDPDHPVPVLVANPAERGGYTADLSLGDLVLVRYDGLDAFDNPIYHIEHKV